MRPHTFLLIALLGAGCAPEESMTEFECEELAAEIVASALGRIDCADVSSRCSASCSCDCDSDECEDACQTACEEACSAAESACEDEVHNAN